MVISKRPKNQIVPNYSLTGDLLAYLDCRLQYRFNSKGSLPPSVPVQQWFGEFMHGVMEEGYLKWKKGDLVFPCKFDDVQAISVHVSKRLAAKGLKPYYNIFAERDTPRRKCEDCIANKRAFESVSLWGKNLFPLVERNEVKLEGNRTMPDFDKRNSRSKYYSIRGVADVITSIRISDVDPDNRILYHLEQNKEVKKMMADNEEFEIIVDYKGAMRPDISPEENTWDHHKWQINTYMWLRRLQLDSEGKTYPIVAGVLLYLNELMPSGEDLLHLKEIMAETNSDVLATGEDLELIRGLKYPTPNFRERRSIRIIPYDEIEIKSSLEKFDGVVASIEANILSEITESNNVMKHWCGNQFKKERCTACDVKCFCVDIGENHIMPKVP